MHRRRIRASGSLTARLGRTRFPSGSRLPGLPNRTHLLLTSRRLPGVVHIRMPIDSIDEVLAALNTIIDDARAKASRVGYFAALYRRVTQSVKDGIAAGRFQNGPLMERLDIVFANRYLDALAQFQAGRQPSRSWAVALEATSDRLPLILQKLLVAMNAHINLDLGIATAAVAPGEQLPTIQADFDPINRVLAALVCTVEQEIGEVSPAIHLLDELGLRPQTTIINFDLQKARDLAWNNAQMLPF